MPRFHQQANSTLSMVRSSWNLEERFKTRVATIWMVKIRFWVWELVLLPMTSYGIFKGILFPIFLYFFCQERLYDPRLYVLLMYLATSRDYFRENRYNPVLLIVEVWIWLGHVVFPFALGGFPRKNYCIWFIFLLHEFMYLLLLVAITYLILHKEMVEKFWCLLEYCEFTLIEIIKANMIKTNIRMIASKVKSRGKEQ